MLKKGKKLLAAFAGVSLLVSTPGAAQAAVGHNQALPAASNDNVNQCPVPEGMSGGRMYKKRSCITLREFFNNPAAHRDDPSYETLMVLYNSSPLSRDMLNRAAEDGVRVCDMELSPTVAAIYSNLRVGVDYARNYSLTNYVANMTHEIAHHFQHLKNTQYYINERSIWENQRAMLAMETAAPVTEVIVLFLAGQAGTIDWRTEISPHDRKYNWLVQFERYYNAQMQQYDDHNRAMNMAATYVWQIVLQDQGKLDFYNDSAARFALLYAEYLTPDDAEYRDEHLADTVNNSGVIGAHINFTSDIIMPRGDALFGSNLAMKELFETVEWYRQSRMRGTDHPAVVTERTRLIAEGNRFIEADFPTVICRIRQGVNTRDAFLAGLPHRQARQSLENDDGENNVLAQDFRQSPAAFGRYRYHR